MTLYLLGFTEFVIATTTFDNLVTAIVKGRNKALKTVLNEGGRGPVQTLNSVLVTGIELVPVEFGGGELVTGSM